MKLKIKLWQLILYIVVGLAAMGFAGWLLSLIPWIGKLETLQLVLHGLWIVLMGAYLLTSRKKWAEKHPKGARIGRKLNEIAVLCLTLSVLLQTAFRFAGI